MSSLEISLPFPSPSAVIMNEHLTEALRRLRRNSSDTNVDRYVPSSFHDSVEPKLTRTLSSSRSNRRLVTNILISFLTTPRADPKRFEMLTLLSSILSWSDLEREQAGLQRASSGSAMNRRPSGAIQKVAKVEEEPASEVSSHLLRRRLVSGDALLTQIFFVSRSYSPSLNSSSNSSSKKLPADPLPPPLLPPTQVPLLPPPQPPTPLSSPQQARHAPSPAPCLLQQRPSATGPSPLGRRLEGLE